MLYEMLGGLFETSVQRGILMAYWAIVAIGKHIIAQHSGTRRNIGIRIDEPTDGGIVISALEVIQL